MATETTVVSGGIGLGGLTFIVLLALKLTGQITLGWFWVITSFIWVPVVVALTAIAVSLAAIAVIYLVAGVAKRL